MILVHVRRVRSVDDRRRWFLERVEPVGKPAKPLNLRTQQKKTTRKNSTQIKLRGTVAAVEVSYDMTVGISNVKYGLCFHFFRRTSEYMETPALALLASTSSLQ